MRVKILTANFYGALEEDINRFISEQDFIVNRVTVMNGKDSNVVGIIEYGGK